MLSPVKLWVLAMLAPKRGGCAWLRSRRCAANLTGLARDCRGDGRSGRRNRRFDRTKKHPLVGITRLPARSTRSYKYTPRAGATMNVPHTEMLIGPFQVSSSAGNSPCSRHQPPRVAASIAAVAINASNRAAAVQRLGPPPVASAALPSASARHRSSVPVLMPILADNVSIGQLCGGSKRATTLSLNFCPYRAMFVFHRPLKSRSYPGDNFFDTGGPGDGNITVSVLMCEYIINSTGPLPPLHFRACSW